MADVKISALPAVAAAATTDIFAIVQGGVTYKATLTQVVAAITSTGLTATAGALTNNLSTGVAGGQSVIGGTAASNSLTLSSTSNATKGKILFGTSAYDEVNNRLGIGTVSPTVPLDVVGLSLFTSGTYPVARFNRTTNSPTAAYNTNDFLATSTVNMPDGFGASFTFSIEDDAAVKNAISVIGAVRSGADNTGSFFISTVSAGTTAEKLRVFPTGNVLIQNGGSFTDAGYRLDVNGTARVQARLTVSQDTTVATQTSAVITTDTANCSIVLRPTGTGAIIAQVPDGTATGGNARGTYAVDLQMIRTNANQVASGVGATIVGGQQNRVTGAYSTCLGGYGAVVDASDCAIFGGESNIASASYSVITGGFRARTTLYAQRASAAGNFAATGDAQTSAITYRRSITGTAITELFLDGSSAAAILNISSPGPTNARAWRAQVDLVAICATAGGGTTVLNDCFMGSYHVGIKRVGTTTSLVGTVSVTNEVSDTSMSTSVVTIDANDTNESLRIQFTPPTTADGTTVIRVVATAYLTEVGR